MRKSETINSVREIIADVLSVKVKEVKDGANLIQDLGADSMDIASIVMLIEEQFDISIPEETLYGIETFDDIRKMIDEKLS